MDTNIAKTIVLVVLFLVTFSFTVLPLKIASIVQNTLDPRRRHYYRNALSLLNCFGGGVFLGACLLDLFPEVRDELSETFDKMHITTSFPVAEFVMVCGFFMAFIVEQIVFTWRENGETHSESQPLLNNHSCNRDSGTCTPSGNFDSHSFFHDSNKHPTLRSMVLLLALSLHSLFEGFAIGLQPQLPELVRILSAVAIHKCVIAFSLGLNIVQSKLKMKAIIMLDLLFSITTPIGIAVGIVIMDFSHSVETTLVSGLLQGIACGTFLFVTFFEVLPHELNGKGERLPKVLATILGFAAICGGLFLEPADDRPPCYQRTGP